MGTDSVNVQHLLETDWDGEAEMDEEDWNRLMMDPLRCILINDHASNDRKYEICLNLQFVSIKRIVSSTDTEDEMKNISGISGIGIFEQHKYQMQQHALRPADDGNDNDDEDRFSIEIVDSIRNPRHVVMEVFEFVHEWNETTQCFGPRLRLDICLEYNKKSSAMTMSVDVLSPHETILGYNDGNRHRFLFQDDHQWTET